MLLYIVSFKSFIFFSASDTIFCMLYDFPCSVIAGNWPCWIGRCSEKIGLIEAGRSSECWVINAIMCNKCYYVPI